MTGEGTMFQQEENKDISLAYAIDRCRQLEKENNQLNKENKELLLQVGELTGRIKEIKKDVPKENNVTCADASGSDLEK